MTGRKPVGLRGQLQVTSSLPKERRFSMAIRRIEKGDAIATVARELGVSRSQLNVRWKAVKERKADDLIRASGIAQDIDIPQSHTEVSGPINERRRMLSFDDFDKRYFGALICPDCKVHHDTPNFHQEIVDAVFDTATRTVINIPPYHSKSTLVTVKTTIYELVKNPNGRHIIVSASQPFAKTFLHGIRQWFENPEMYAHSAGNLIDDYGPFVDQYSSKTQTQMYMAGRVSSEKDPSIACVGVTNQIYGRRADRIIFDDIATLENQRNPEQVQNQLEWIDKMALSRIGGNGKAIFVGTRISAGDIYSHLELREGYRVIKYPCILNEEDGETLWPGHFPYEQAVLRRSEMKPEDWQLVYQNVDTPGLGSSFPSEVLDECLDRARVVGQYDANWKLFIGLDPAGGGKQSGYTALVLLGYDRDTQKLHVIDTINVRAMKAFQLKDQLLDWCNSYDISELRVESNGIQSQLVQFNTELMLPLTQKGVRVVPHYTHGNKWDSQFGVEAIAPWFYNRQVTIPWGNSDSQHRMRTMMDQFIGFPMAERSDLVMAFWFAWLGAKESVARQQGPLYENRKMPGYVNRRRRVADPRTGNLWAPTDPLMPDFGRGEMDHPTNRKKLVNVAGHITVY